ncbi:hypothetical protein AAFN46_02305 [Pseudomonas sp. CAU 1711]|uniref:hypothetical protein n=1 Tax=Pseudomonas sp. CAU 1711 TaxID=3140356 RepID=UPI00326154FB
MNGSVEYTSALHIDAQYQPLRLYLNRLNGVHYASLFESTRRCELTPLHGKSLHVSLEELDNAEIWQLLF